MAMMNQYGRIMLKTFTIIRVSFRMPMVIRGWQTVSTKLIVSVEEVGTGCFILPAPQNILMIFWIISRRRASTVTKMAVGLGSLLKNHLAQICLLQNILIRLLVKHLKSETPTELIITWEKRPPRTSWC